jgi:hypothetical protein
MAAGVVVLEALEAPHLIVLVLAVLELHHLYLERKFNMLVAAVVETGA